MWVLSDFFCYFRLRRTLKSEFSLTYTGDRLRQPAYEIKLMLHVARLMSISSDFLLDVIDVWTVW